MKRGFDGIFWILDDFRLEGLEVRRDKLVRRLKSFLESQPRALVSLIISCT